MSSRLGINYDISTLLSLTNDKNVHTKAYAISAIGRIGGVNAIEPLMQALNDDAIKDRAIDSFKYITDKKAIDGLISILKDSSLNLEIRENASGALGRIGRPAFKKLCNLLDDEDFFVSSKATYALAKIGDKSSVPKIIKLLNKSDYIGWEIPYALRILNDQRAIKPIIYALKKDKFVDSNYAIITLLNLSKKYIYDSQLSASILKVTIHVIKNDPIDFDNITKLLKITGESGIDQVILLLKHKNYLIRRKAAQILGRVGDPRAIPALINAFNDKDDLVQYRAIESLGKIGEPSIEPLLRLLNNNDKKIRSRALKALSQIYIK